MVCLHTALCNIKRRKKGVALNMGICLLAVLLLNLYLGSIESNRSQLLALPDAIPIYGRVASLNGSRQAGLNISEEIVAKLGGSSYTKDMVYTDSLKTGIGDFEPEDWVERLNYVVLGTNSIQAASGLESGQITMKEGMGLDFLTSSYAGCIVSREVMEEKHWSIGERIPLNVYYYERLSLSELYLNPLDLMEVEIVGYMDTSSITVSIDEEVPDFLVPVGWIRESYERKELSFFADSLSFYLKNSLQLNEFIDTLEKEDIRLSTVVPSAQDSLYGSALFLRDSVFIATATRLRQGMDVLNSFFPFAVTAMVSIGYIVAYLRVQARKREISVMRSLGVSKKLYMGIFCVEQSILMAGSGVLGGIVSILFIFGEVKVVLIMEAVFLVCYLMGCIVAMWQAGRKNVMEALASAD